MKTFKIKDASEILKGADIYGNKNATFNNARTIEEADGNSIVWVKYEREDNLSIINVTKASVIIIDELTDIGKVDIRDRCLIVTKNPKLLYTRIIKAFFIPPPKYGISNTAVIENEAEIHPETFIGPNTYFGKSKIGKGSIIHGNCFIYDNVIIGENVRIFAGAIIGSEGFGYSRNLKNEFEHFPHLGGVIIEDNVDIGANTCIDRGALGNTIIKEGAKIDNLVHIAHNVIIGKHSAVIANSMIGGSVIIDDYSWVAPSASILNQLHIGERATIGMGSVVMKNIPDNEVWTGFPAMPIEKFIKIQKKLRNG